MMTVKSSFSGSEAGAGWRIKYRGIPLMSVLALLLLPFAGTGVRAQKMTVSEFFGRGERPAAPLPVAPQRFRASWMDNTELRTESRDFDFAQQRYLLRLSPSTPGIVRAQSALFNTREARPDFVGMELACEESRQRHEDWLDLYLIDRELRLLTSLDSVLTDRATVLNRQSASLDFDWRDLLELKEERTELSLRQKTLLERRRLLLQPYGLNAVTLDFSTFPTVEELPLEGAGNKVADDPEISYELALAARELELEQAEKRQYLDFIQAEYQGPHADPFAERFSIGLGFQLAGNGNRKLKIRELELEQSDLRRKQMEERTNAQEQYDRRLALLRSARNLHEEMRAIFAAEAAEMEQISSNLARRQGFDPLPLLDIKSRALKNQLRLLNSTQEVLERFLNMQEDNLCGVPSVILWQP